MSAPYRKELEAKGKLDERGVKNFVPMCHKVVERGGKKMRKLLPAIHNLIFVYATKEEVKASKERIACLQYYTRPMMGRNVLVTVPDAEMEQFIAVSEKHNEKLVYLNPDEVNLAKGTPVRIIGGAFNGVEGWFVKVKGVRNRRLVVAVQGVMALAAEVTPDLIEVIDKPIMGGMIKNRM